MSRQRLSCPRGFALHDLLVLLAILLMFLPLLLVAIQRVRSAREQMRCANNLSQLALAMHNHHNDYNIFPTGGGNAEQGRAYLRGGKTERNPPLGGRLPDGDTVAAAPFQEWGWAYQILPYIEQDATYRDSIDDRVRETPVAIYFCPFRRQPSLNEKNAKGLRMAGIDYAGNGGITGPCKKVQTLKNYAPPYGDYTSTGLIIRSSAWYPGGRMRARWVTLDGGVPDGTSNTMLLAEKRMQRTKINKNPPNDDWSYVDGWSSDTIIRFHPEDEKLRPAQDSDDPVPEFAMGSVHQGYFTAVFADGSVRKIRYTVKPEVLAVAMIRDDGVPIDPRDLER